MRRRRAAYLLVLCLGAAGSACEIVAGIQDLRLDADASAPASDGAGGDATVAPGDDAGQDVTTDSVGDVGREGGTEGGPDGCGSVEICTDGIDNDCNGLVDCADPACSPGFACVPVWPSGFTAPVALFDGFVDGGPAPAPPKCLSPYSVQTGVDEYDTPVLGPVACSCSCGVACSAPTIAAYSNSSCSGTALGQASAPVGSCTELENAQGGVNSCGTVLAGGVPSCLPHENYTLPSWNPATRAAWAGVGRTCAPDTVHKYFSGDAGGCPSGEYCAEVPAVTFGGGHVCVLSNGQVGCPSAYPIAHTYYDGGSSNAHCVGGCTCADAGALGCSLSVNCYTGAGTCNGAGYPVPADAGGCVATNNLGSGVLAVSASVTATTTGSCTPGGNYAWNGQGVTPSGGEVTVCCH